MSSFNSTPLRIEELVKRFGGVTADDGISPDIKPGECFGPLGSNGAGEKTWSHIAGFVIMDVSTAFAVAAFGILLATACKTRAQ